MPDQTDQTNQTNAPHPAPQRPAGRRGAFFPDAIEITTIDDWLSIAPDGEITLFSGKVELGTGIRTALAQIVADELDVALERVRVVMGDTTRTPNEGYTAGSQSVATFWRSARRVAAEARQALLAEAAARLGAAPAELVVAEGIVRRRDDPTRAISYAELRGGQRFDLPAHGDAPLKTTGERRYVGGSTQRLDLAAKFSGAPSFVHDLRLPGMLHARVVRPPSPGATLKKHRLPILSGAQGVQIGSFVAVVAEREERAVSAAQQIRQALRWREAAPLPDFGTLHDYLRQQPTTDVVLREVGDAEAALASATTVVSAVYDQPFQAHASAGPSCAVARVEEDGGVTVWCSSQGVFALRDALAELLELEPERVRVVFMEGAGCYGQNGADDAAADAALIARTLGKPVRVQWSREDEFLWEPKSPAMRIEARGGLDAEGRIVGWRYDVWTPSHANRPRAALDLIAGQLAREQPAPPRPSYFGGERNAPNDYDIPQQRVVARWLAQSPLRASSMRSLGAAANTFANESLMDELALAVGADPVDFRLRHLSDERARAVVEAAARLAGWGAPLAAGAGRGVAFARYENTEAYVAAVATVAVDSADVVRVRRVVVAHDCGLIINPDGVRNQIEGNVIQATSRALKEEVRFDASHIISSDWQSYPILTFAEVPEVEIVLLDRPDQPPVGSGEATTVVIAPAIANAIANAVGARLRQVPFTPARLRATIDSLAD